MGLILWHQCRSQMMIEVTTKLFHQKNLMKNKLMEKNGLRKSGKLGGRDNGRSTTKTQAVEKICRGTNCRSKKFRCCLTKC